MALSKDFHGGGPPMLSVLIVEGAESALKTFLSSCGMSSDVSFYERKLALNEWEVTCKTSLCEGVATLSARKEAKKAAATACMRNMILMLKSLKEQEAKAKDVKHSELDGSVSEEEKLTKQVSILELGASCGCHKSCLFHNMPLEDNPFLKKLQSIHGFSTTCIGRTGKCNCFYCSRVKLFGIGGLLIDDDQPRSIPGVIAKAFVGQYESDTLATFVRNMILPALYNEWVSGCVK